jgi:hypothetical protein
MISQRKADWMCRFEKSNKNVEMKKMIEKLSFYVDSLERLGKILLFILNKQ